MLRKLIKILFNRISIVAVLLCVQVGFFILLMLRGARYSQYITWGLTLISLIVVQYIVNKDDSPEFKLAWCIPILIFPIFGGLLYLIIKFQSSNERVKSKKDPKALPPPLKQEEDTMEELFAYSPGGARQAGYVAYHAGYPVYKGSSAKYLHIGEEFFKELIAQLEKAEKFIFMEYFIIASGRMWSVVLELIEQKAKEGVDVRIIYDSMGSLLLPSSYYKQLEEKGIRCVEFNKFRPVMSAIQNNRDHRKICVIDGRVAFTGGINIGDEYINELKRCGHWKDNSVMIEGLAVKSFTTMFLQMWNTCYDTIDNSDYMDYSYPVDDDGYIMPYADIPGDYERVCESVYLNIISRANTYLYITTPYFIVGEEFITALELAAKGGVDVRIITPHIWDKRFVHITTRSYYKRLIKAGVRVFEYTPGFIHAKTFLCDGEIATVGTANLDYRSLYLHYECGVWMYGCKCIGNIKNDILAIMEKSHEMTLEECEKQSLATSIVQSLMRTFTPLF